MTNNFIRDIKVNFNMKNYLILFFLNLGINGCIPKEGPNCHKSIGVINNSSKDIWVYRSDKNGKFVGGCYTTLSEFVPANSSREKVVNQPIRDNCYEKHMNGTFRGGKLEVYIFSIDPHSLKDNCDTTKLKTYLLETRALTVAELQKNNWTFTYPK
ncbi:hypothetical protein [Emticicia agri]|uniref:Uncharacterized protein n=1 Tax=Emticicia agri TaxID=2492393 RepID=A0A4Q5LWB9_9BACT|nr:hypothetical protein [Emticicia agri]RYU93859.1 hypothetical protein EWM59_19660 [Emticicia agri]